MLRLLLLCALLRLLISSVRILHKPTSVFLLNDSGSESSMHESDLQLPCLFLRDSKTSGWWLTWLGRDSMRAARASTQPCSRSSGASLPPILPIALRPTTNSQTGDQRRSVAQARAQKARRQAQPSTRKGWDAQRGVVPDTTRALRRRIQQRHERRQCLSCRRAEVAESLRCIPHHLTRTDHRLLSATATRKWKQERSS